eukprot:TRINITY_DN62138_c0_g1_i1.p1 TRINITY_DN62138_c0_g1~~TRINITY_DN62138_c0_g1_i1.p1  ORF type:complete len:753 (-),score=95.72 TRINITY_DN62138_c0_g1_i1:1877-3883(-)
MEPILPARPATTTQAVPSNRTSEVTELPRPVSVAATFPSSATHNMLSPPSPSPTKTTPLPSFKNPRRALSPNKMRTRTYSPARASGVVGDSNNNTEERGGDEEEDGTHQRAYMSPATGSPVVGFIRPPPLSKVDFTSLLTLVAPRPKFQGQVRHLCKTDFMDCSWLLALHQQHNEQQNQQQQQRGTPTKHHRTPEASVHGGVVPSVSLTVDNLALDYYTLLEEDDNGKSYEVLLNSPRSVLASLRTGVNPLDVQHRSSKYFETEGVGVRVAADVAASRYAHHCAVREAKLRLLVDEYHDICAKVSQEEVLTFFKLYDPEKPATAMPLNFSFELPQHKRADNTMMMMGVSSSSSGGEVQEEWIVQRRAKSRRMIEAQQRKIEKAVQANLELQQKLLENSQKKQGFLQDKERIEREREQKKQERELRRQQRDQHFKNTIAEMERKNRDAEERKRLKMADREARQTAMMAQAAMERRVRAEEKRERNAARLAATMAKNDQLIQEKIAAYHHREDIADKKRELQQQAQQAAFREKAEQDRRKNEKRTKIKLQSKQAEQEKSQMLLARQAAQDEAFAELLNTRAHEKELLNAASHMAIDTKLDHVERKKRVMQYNQLRTIDQIQRKGDRIQRNEELRADLLLEVKNERRDMERNKRQMLQSLAQKYGGEFTQM